MIGSIVLVAPVIFMVISMAWAFWEAGYRPRRGRHRGKYTFRMWWPHGVFLHGLHRGVYVEKPEWKRFDPPRINPPPRIPPSELVLDALDRHREVRKVVQAELASTPIYTGLRYGEFGDVAIDRATEAPVCPPVEA